MTERLYYLDPYLREFDAEVIVRQASVKLLADRDGRPAVVLNQTAFYPSSGGQPHDTGSLGDARVLDVIDLDDGRIAHVVDRPPAEAAVHGAVD